MLSQGRGITVALISGTAFTVFCSFTNRAIPMGNGSTATGANESMLIGAKSGLTDVLIGARSATERMPPREAGAAFGMWTVAVTSHNTDRGDFLFDPSPSSWDV
jgi:hypothetical protein